MFKKNFMLLVMTCLFTLGVMAQGVTSPKAGAVTNTPIKPTGDQLWWGYFDGSEKNVGGIGLSNDAKSGDTYDCAIFIPGNHVLGKGQTVKAIRLFISSALNMSNFKIWMSKRIPMTPDEADIEVKSIDKSLITDGATDGWTPNYDPINDFAFDTPYEIDDDGVYIGYSFKIDKVVSAQDQLPVCTSLNPYKAEENANFMNMNGAGWKDYTGLDCGNLAIRVLLEGQKKDLQLNVKAEIPSVTAPANGDTELPVTILNMGSKGADRFSYVVTFDGVKSEEKEFVLDSHLGGLGTMTECLIPAKVGDVIGTQNVKVEITKVNGVENKTPLNTAEGSVLVLSQSVTRKVAVEIYTGTWAQLAAKGYVGAARARDIYGDEVVINNIHFGGDDPMIIPDYAKLKPLTAPVCNVNRIVKGIDPYYGRQGDDIFDLGNVIDEMRAVVPVAKIKAEGIINADKSKVTASSYTTFFYNDDVENYQVAYVLSTNGLTGTGDEWLQKNLFADFKRDPNVDTDWEFEPLFYDWIAMDKWIEGFEYNDVPVATIGLVEGVDGSIQYPFVADETQEHSVEFDLNAIGEKIQNKDELYLSTFIIDRRDGSIVNADCQKVVDESLAAIEDVDAEEGNEIVRRYSVDGTLLSAPVKGVNIVEYADGRIVKVIVK